MDEKEKKELLQKSKAIAVELARFIQDKAMELLVNQENAGLQGLVFQTVTSYLLAHCIVIIKHHKGPKEDIKFLIDCVLEDALTLSNQKPTIYKSH